VKIPVDDTMIILDRDPTFAVGSESAEGSCSYENSSDSSERSTVGGSISVLW
jgi:hypothetical protein